MLQPIAAIGRPDVAMPLPRCLRAALILATLASPAVGAVELPRESERWIELTTGNFTFFSNAGPRTTRAVASDLEELRAVLAHVTALDLDSPVPILVYVFKNRGSFEPYRHYYASQPVATAGYFLERNNANCIAICADAREDASSIVYHEYVHFVASAPVRRCGSTSRSMTSGGSAPTTRSSRPTTVRSASSTAALSPRPWPLSRQHSPSIPSRPTPRPPASSSPTPVPPSTTHDLSAGRRGAGAAIRVHPLRRSSGTAPRPPAPACRHPRPRSCSRAGTERRRGSPQRQPRSRRGGRGCQLAPAPGSGAG